MLPYLFGNEKVSPRTEIMLETGCKSESTYCAAPGCGGCNPSLPCGPYPCTGAIIVGEYKLILGMQDYGFWQSPVYPNASTNTTAIKNKALAFDCGAGCLFNIFQDESEKYDLATKEPAILSQLTAKFFAHNATAFLQPKLAHNATRCEQYATSHNGYVGPYLG